MLILECPAGPARKMPRPVKGQRTPGSGRKKGTGNHKSLELRCQILQALDEVGGVDYLVQQAKENPASFLTLVGKVIPKEISIEQKTRHIIESDLIIQLIKKRHEKSG